MSISEQIGKTNLEDDETKIKELIDLGIKRNIIVYDGESEGEFSRRLVYLMKRVMWNTTSEPIEKDGKIRFLHDSLQSILVYENDSFYDDDNGRGVYFWEKFITSPLQSHPHLNIEGIRLKPTKVNMAEYYTSIEASLPYNKTTIVVGIGKNNNIIIGAY